MRGGGALRPVQVTMRFAVGPILALIGVMAVAVRCALAANGTLPW